MGEYHMEGQLADEVNEKMREEELMKPRRIFKITLGDLKGLKEVGYLSEKGIKYLEEIEEDEEEET